MYKHKKLRKIKINRRKMKNRSQGRWSSRYLWILDGFWFKNSWWVIRWWFGILGSCPVHLELSCKLISEFLILYCTINHHQSSVRFLYLFSDILWWHCLTLLVCSLDLLATQLINLTVKISILVILVFLLLLLLFMWSLKIILS